MQPEILEDGEPGGEMEVGEVEVVGWSTVTAWEVWKKKVIIADDNDTYSCIHTWKHAHPHTTTEWRGCWCLVLTL